MATALVATLGGYHPFRHTALRTALEVAAALAAVVVVCLLAYGRYWQAMISRELLSERKRLASSLHDGLAQELALISRSVHRLDASDSVVRHITSAVERALYESQEAIQILNGGGAEALPAALERLAAEIGEREGARVEARVAPGVQASAAQRQALLRVLREGVVNSVRHGHASEVLVELDHQPTDGTGPRLALRVRDNGEGFDPHLPPRGLGLVMMRDRAHRLGGELKIESAPGKGALLELLV
jgi:signal transduction histidine kinase